MSVQEIEAVISQLSPDEFREVERWLSEFRQRRLADDLAYGVEEYGLTREELIVFEKRQAKRNAAADQSGETTVFHGPFNPSSLDSNPLSFTMPSSRLSEISLTQNEKPRARLSHAQCK